MSETDQIQAVRAFYLHGNGDKPSIYHIWESGGGRGDVTTPAQSSPAYRQHMGDLLRGFLAESPDPGLLSLGCGNGMIESGIAAGGIRVLGVDAMEDAVELARARGVNAVRADVLSWTPPPGPWTVLYADGILGHLYDPVTGITNVLNRFKSWLAPGDALVISNDPPRTDAELQENPNMPPAYFFISQQYLHQRIEECGFRDVTSSIFRYSKPVTGPRDRVIVTARA